MAEEEEEEEEEGVEKGEEGGRPVEVGVRSRGREKFQDRVAASSTEKEAVGARVRARFRSFKALYRRDKATAATAAGESMGREVVAVGCL